MLTYFAHGERDYEKLPTPPHLRQGWEFQAVLKGRIKRTGHEADAVPRPRSLWVSGPGSGHGWAGDGRPATVAVWHFTPVPEALRLALGHGGSCRLDLGRDDLSMLGSYARLTEPHYPGPSPLTERLAEAALGHLRWLLARERGIDTTRPQADRDAYAVRVVGRAVDWYRQHLGATPSVTRAAEALAISEPHLRRLFRAAGHPPPKRVFDGVRLEEARRLLTHTDLKLAAIARRLGYSGPEAMSRAFRSRLNRSPGAVRRARPGERS